MLPKRLEDVTPADLQRLHDEQVAEQRTLDYKRDLKFSSREEKKELVADILAFANASGGDLVFGMDEARDPATGAKLGYPNPPVGTAFSGGDDDLKRTIEQCARDNSDPRLMSVQVEVVDGGFANGKVVIVRVPKSPAGPHMSMIDNRFYSRGATSRFQLDARQLRSAFVDADEMERAVRSFRSERVVLIDSRRRVQADDSTIATEELPRRLMVKPSEALLVVHVVASSFVDRGRRIEIAERLVKDLPTENHIHIRSRYNVDGIVAWPESDYGREDSKAALEYWQVFRSGAVEYVDAYSPNVFAEQSRFSGPSIEGRVLSAIGASTRLLTEAGALHPMFVFISVLNVRGWKILDKNSGLDPRVAKEIDREAVVLPDTSIETPASDPDAALRGAFDVLWQAGGYARSPSYGQDGRRT